MNDKTGHIFSLEKVEAPLRGASMFFLKGIKSSTPCRDNDNLLSPARGWHG